MARRDRTPIDSPIGAHDMKRHITNQMLGRYSMYTSPRRILPSNLREKRKGQDLPMISQKIISPGESHASFIYVSLLEKL